ncbi:hypothetical protein [Streptosporangium sp. OZ121]|uniref:hypothetical protein n=1 Tax=Streptosporangium sp. OZ121 TaxID=3444183 RepID=UPI003F7A9232
MPAKIHSPSEWLEELFERQIPLRKKAAIESWQGTTSLSPSEWAILRFTPGQQLHLDLIELMALAGTES